MGSWYGNSFRVVLDETASIARVYCTVVIKVEAQNHSNAAGCSAEGVVVTPEHEGLEVVHVYCSFWSFSMSLEAIKRQFFTFFTSNFEQLGVKTRAC